MEIWNIPARPMAGCSRRNWHVNSLIMALNYNEKMVSPYYPPRERWYGRFFYWGLANRRRLALDRVHLPKETTLGGIILGVLIPGMAVYIRGPRLWGKIALSACAILFLLFIVWMGYPFGNLAFGLLIAIHASGFAFYCSPVLREKEFFARIGYTLALVIGFGLLFYAPMRSIIQNHWARPLLRNGHVIVVGKFASARSIKRGEWVMYSLPRLFAGNAHGEGGAVWIREGYGWGQVLAVAGDRVSFGTNSFSVNGAERPRLPHMPQGGDLTVLEKKWFIWPELGISGHGNTSEAIISATMLQLATVPEGQFVGKPFKRWFWREQIFQ